MSDQTVLRRIGVILRDIPVRVLDASARGCLVESRERLPEGAVGLLEVAGEQGRTSSRCVSAGQRKSREARHDFARVHSSSRSARRV